MTIHLCLFNHMANGFVSKVTNNQQQMLKCKEDFGEDTGVHNILLSAGVVQDLDFDFCLELNNGPDNESSNHNLTYVTYLRQQFGPGPNCDTLGLNSFPSTLCLVHLTLA